ncbi:MAG: amidase [Bradyrhizobium sp.]|nr:amidase [Bradyrhizobium sp.]
MNETRRDFILAAASTVAATSLPRAIAGTADAVARNDKGAKTMDYRSARELIGLLQSRQVSAVELTDRAIARIEARDGKLNAVVVRDFARARAAATEADKALARGERAPLLGLPMTVKECANVAGLPTTWGIPRTEKLPVHEDAVTVARLKAAGAIVLGKTNLPLMLADMQSYNAIYGTTSNPWDFSRTPGGSSGGAAAALAAGYVALELGTDLGGSLRIPAHFCGIFAHKPTHGIVPGRGIAPPGTPSLAIPIEVPLAVAGPMARSAGDLALALDIIAGPDATDALGYKLVLSPPRHTELRDFRVLVLDQHPLLPTSGSVRAALDALADRLGKHGVTVARTSPLLPDLARIGRTFVQMLSAVMAAESPDDVYAGLKSRAAALPAEADSIAAARLRAATMSYRDWVKSDRLRIGITDRWQLLFRDFDVVLCPVTPTPAFAHDHSEMAARRILVDGTEIPYGEQVMWNGNATLAGLPSTAMPIGFSSEGLPIGMQIVGPAMEDRTTIAFAELVEREYGGFVPPPAFKS